jgi:hypothetical protein
VKSDHFIPRLRLPVSGLEQYLIDEAGSLWRHGGERNGRDRRLQETSFAMCMRRLGRDYSSYKLVPWPVIPGVWVMLPVTRIPEGVPYLAHVPLDEFFRRHCFGEKREHPPGWSTWNSQINDAAARFDAERSSTWFTLSDISSAEWIAESTPTPVAIWGPLAFLSISLKLDVSYPRDDRYTCTI